MTETKKLLLIDGNSVAFRAFFALYQAMDKFKNADGLHTGAIYGFKNMLDTILANVQPTHALVAFDAGKTTFRTNSFEEYKGGRAKTPSELSEQFPYLRDLLDGYGISHYELPDYEADDIIGTMSRLAEKEDFLVTIVTGDRDLTQLATEQITVDVTIKGVSEIESYTPEHVLEKYGLSPLQIIDMKGLAGDASDNYPGVTKIGEKTAIKLLKEYGSIEKIYENIDAMKPSKMKENLINDREMAFMCQDLARIRTDAPVKLTIEDVLYHGIQQDKLIPFFKLMNFRSFLDKMPVDTEEQTELVLEEKDPIVFHWVKELTAKELKPQMSLYVEMLEDNYHSAPIAALGVSDGENYYLLKEPTELGETFKTWLEDADIPKRVFDVKRTYVALNRLGVQLAGTHFDMLLVSYLLNTNDNSKDVSEVALQHGLTEVDSDEAVYGKGVKKALPTDDAVFGEHLARKLKVIWDLESKMLNQLQENKQIDLYQEMELPLALVLARMEIQGIAVDASRLESMEEEFTAILTTIEQKIYQEAGAEFNLNSPKQLGVILFEKMNLPVIKKTKTGYSTAVDVLEQLRPQAPIVDDILTYRQIAKIQSTYVVGLLKVINPEDHKIHTRYIQTLTQTGRLSSVDPNLQNIPIRLEEGRKIRQAFVPSHPDWEIFSSDYSQIELRVLAHISDDEGLKEAFREDLDIHASTASRVFGMAQDEVTPNMRRQAKAVNFGIVYGISDYGLSQNLGITRKQAKQFIETYFEQFPGVKRYMAEIVREAKDQGFVETLFHRRRYLSDINSRNFNLRSFAERTAMNTPIQGTAADILKVAMITMEKELKKNNLQAKMLLQVHDELVFEAPASEIKILEELVPRVMDSAVALSVPLKVESSYGKTWYEAK